MASVETSCHGNSSCIKKMVVLVMVMGSFLTLNAEQALTRSSFPKDFIFGAGSSAYQFEGAVNEDGRGPSIWDKFTHQYPEKIVDQSNGDVALDFYHRYKLEDIKLAKDMGLDSFRFSISWSRILPKGTISGGINKLGIQFYNNLINELHLNGIQPFVTIFNWDLPQALEDSYGGFLSPKIVDDFANYSDLVFKEYGDRVKYWTTLNMPNIMTEYGYSPGAHAPGRCSKQIGNCTAGNSGIEPYIVGHNLLFCHAATAQLYRNKYKKSQNGAIGISVEASLVKPMDDTVSSNLAALRATDFITGW